MSKTEATTPVVTENENADFKTPENEEVSRAPSSAGRSTNLETIAADLITDMPQVQEHALAQERANDDAKNSEYEHLKDVDGNAFNSERHKTDKNGEPTQTKKGNLIKKGGGRKPKTEKQKSYIGGNASPENNHAAQLTAQARASGTVAANLLMTLGIALGGEEWQPRADHASGLNEKTMLENAMSDYFESTGQTDLPPSMVLIVAIGAYALPRFTMPKTQSRLSSVKSGIKKWFINRKLKKMGLKAEPTQHPTSAGLAA